MKRKFTFGVIVISAFFAGSMFVDQVSGQNSKTGSLSQKTEVQSPEAPGAALLVEDFSFSGALSSNGWSAHSGIGTNPPTTTPGLTYSGYPGSGIGNAVLVGNAGGEDVNRTLSAEQNVNGAVVYFSFLVNVTDAATAKTGDYFIHIGDRVASDAFTLFAARVFARIVGGSVNFGLSNTSTAAYGTTNFNKNQTYLMIVKYTINTGGADTTQLWVIPSGVPASEAAAGTPEVTDTTTTGQDIIDSIALRQGSSSTSCQEVVDGIRVGTTWADIVGSAAPVQHVVDFDGNGKTDFAIVRNTGGGPGGQMTWYIQSDSGVTSGFAWGITTDRFVPADYDGDGKTDIAVWRPAAPGSSHWYILNSNGFTLSDFIFGQTGDDPSVQGDYDGDGKADIAVYRAGAAAGAQSHWWYRRSSVGGSTCGASNCNDIAWGQNGDSPAPGDYDGDGKYDFVIRRDNGGGQARFWQLFANGTENHTNVFGTPTDVIVPGDYDGDGKTDIATLRGIGGVWNWFYRPSSGGADVNFQPWGVSATDLPVQGDYDGDGKTDRVIWRPNADPTQNYFWVLRSTTGLSSSTEWGQNGDYPVANFNSH